MEDHDPEEATETTRLLQNAKPNGLNSEDRQDGMARRPEAPVSWRHRPSVLWLLGPFTIYMIATGGVIVPELNLYVELVCRQHFADQQLLHPDLKFPPVLPATDNPQCKEAGPQQKVATFMLVSSLVAGILSAIVTPKLGHLSDRYGRTRLLALTSCGGLLKTVIIILAARFPKYVDYRWIILGALFDGLGGSSAAASTLTQSYTSDCTVPSKRAVIFGYMAACIYVGLAVGPLLAGYLVEWTGSLISIFYITVILHFFFIVFTGFVIPESLSKERQSKAREAWDKERRTQRRDHDDSKSKSWWSTAQDWNPLRPIKILWPTGPGTSSRLRMNLVALAVSSAALIGATSAVGPVVLLYAELMFRWGNLETSKFMTTLALARTFVLLVVSPAINYFGRIRPVARRQRETGHVVVEESTGVDSVDIWILRVSLIMEVLGTVGCALARTPSAFVFSILLGSFQGLGGATIQSMVTKHFPSERVGQILGAVGTMGALARVMSPIMFDGTYALTVGSFPQAIFLVLGSLLAVAMVSGCFIRMGVYWEDVKKSDESPTELFARRSEADDRPSVEEGERLLQGEMLSSR